MKILGVIFLLFALGCAIGFWNTADKLSSESDNYFWFGIFLNIIGVVLLLI